MTVSEATFWMPRGASTVAGEVDALYYFIYWLSVVLFVGIVGAMTYFVVRYKRKTTEEIPHGPHHSLPLEVTWTVIPLILVVFIFVWGFRGYMHLAIAPGNAMEVHVTGQQWKWTFQYPGTAVDEPDMMVVPVKKPVKLIMEAKDVLHSFWVPEFRVKHDIVPGQYSMVWFEALEKGDYRVLCTEYCGLQHSDMLATVRVVDQADYEKWLKEKDGGNMTPEQKGEKLFTTRACSTCHSKEATRLVGPGFKGLFGRTEQLEGGGSVTVDENYITESIKKPRAKVVAGYPPAMPENYTDMPADEVSALIAYIKTLK